MRLWWRFRSQIKRALVFPPLHDVVMRLQPRRDIFDKAYATRAWGSTESGSGTGSELGATASLRVYLPELCGRLGVRTLLDAPCGDWSWMRLVDLSGIDYVGVDTVPRVIDSNQANFARPGVRFMVADLTKDRLPRVDLILCRDCWVHLSFRDISALLENFRRSGATWLLVSNSPHAEQNVNQLTGISWRHLNLRRSPFDFPPPMEARKDHYPDVPFEITLWRMSDLPNIEA